jgi:hypothetical protein
MAERAIKQLAQTHGLELGPLLEGMQGLGPYMHVSPQIEPCSTSAVVFDAPLGIGIEPPERQVVEVDILEPGPVGGAAVWFEALYGDVVVANPPGDPGHWGHMVAGFPVELGGPKGGRIALAVEIEDGHVTVRPA